MWLNIFKPKKSNSSKQKKIGEKDSYNVNGEDYPRSRSEVSFAYLPPDLIDALAAANEVPPETQKVSKQLSVNDQSSSNDSCRIIDLLAKTKFKQRVRALFLSITFRK